MGNTSYGKIAPGSWGFTYGEPGAIFNDPMDGKICCVHFATSLNQAGK